MTSPSPLNFRDRVSLGSQDRVHLLYGSGWLQTQDSPVSATEVLGLQVSAMTLALTYIFYY